MADRRYTDDNNTEWDSRFEAEVYRGLRALEIPVRKCEQGTSDTLSYETKVQRGRCLECEGDKVVQRRTYTPDLHITLPRAHGPDDVYVEAKGYWPAPKRNLLRSVVKSNPDLSLIFIFQADRRATGKSRYSDYAAKFFPNSRIAIYPWYKGIKKQETLDKKLAFLGEQMLEIFHFLGAKEKSN